MNTAWGLSTTGVMIYNGISAEGVDPFYPTLYGGISDLVTEKVDWCLAHPQAQGMFHYHAASTCLADPTTFQNKKGKMDLDISDLINETYLVSLPYRSVYGIAKDGRPIYTPLKEDGRTYDACEVDVCNGKMIDGHYSYVSTLFHPYFMGCFGPGSKPNVYQQCSTKPRLCGVEYTELAARHMSMGLAAITAVFAMIS